MKTYKLTRGNLTRYVGKDYAVVYEKGENKDLRIIAKTYAGGNVVPKICIGEKTYSPELLNYDTYKALGYETFTIGFRK